MGPPVGFTHSESTRRFLSVAVPVGTFFEFSAIPNNKQRCRIASLVIMESVYAKGMRRRQKDFFFSFWVLRGLTLFSL